MLFHRRTILLTLLLVSAISMVTAKDFTIVLDPGHGGGDPGAVGRMSREKNINLSVALKVGELLNRHCSNTKVVYTRRTDVFVELIERAKIANRNKADLFISIHTNAQEVKRGTSGAAKGTETITLGTKRSDINLEVAKRENSVILLEDNYQTKYEGFDPNSPESYIMFEFIQGNYVRQSIDLAAGIQKQFRGAAYRQDRGVKQAGLLVLVYTSMPSVLVELGFISNYDEERYLCSESGQDALARSIFNAIYEYKADIDRKQGIKVDPLPTAPTYEPTQTTSTTTTRTNNNESQANATTTREISSSSSRIEDNQIYYKVQFATSPTLLKPNSSQLKGLSPVEHYKEGSLYKYTYSCCNSQHEAQKVLNQIRKKFPDAFVIKMQNGQRIR